MLPLLYNGTGVRQRAEKSACCPGARRFGRPHGPPPNQLSGGQQQRVAIARALVNDPAILLADEPTGNLDSKTGAEIIGLFQRLHQEQGQTVIFVTHDPFIAHHTNRIIRLADGKIVGDERIVEPLPAGTPRPRRCEHDPI